MADLVQPSPTPAQVAAAEAKLPDEIASYLDKITVTFERRPDGGLRVYSDELPGLTLSHAEHATVLADIKPAIEGLIFHRLTAAETARDEAEADRDALKAELHEAMHGQDAEGLLSWVVSVTEVRDRLERERDAALARAERLEEALKLAEGMTPPDDTPRQSDWTYVAMTWADIDAIRAALAQPAPAEER